MSAFIDENTQFADSGGIPLAGGKVFIGKVGLDPVLNPEPIFADRALQIDLANPQTLNAEGRSTNKIWIAGEYSLLVRDVLGGQHLQELDQGASTGGQIVDLTNIQGTEDIVAAASPAIITLVDKTIYILQAIGANGGPMTLKIDTTAVTPILQNVDQQIQKNKIQDTQTVIVTFNKGATQPQDFFEWTNPSDKVIYLTKAASLLSATTTLIWDSLGNFIDIGLGASPVTSFGIAPQAGALRKIKMADNGITFQHTLGVLECPGGADLVTAVGDNFEVIAGTTTQAIIRQYQRQTQLPFFTFVGPIDMSTPAVSFTLLENLVNVQEIEIVVNGWSSDVGGKAPKIMLGTPTIETSGYNGQGTTLVDTGTASNVFQVESNVTFNGFLIGTGESLGGSTLVDFTCRLVRMGVTNIWKFVAEGDHNIQTRYITGHGQITLPGALTKIILTTRDGESTSDQIDAGVAHIAVR